MSTTNYERTHTMTIKELIETLSNYNGNTKVKICVNDKEDNIRCFISHNTDTLVLADATYEN